jgi:hypothetical protein
MKNLVNSVVFPVRGKTAQKDTEKNGKPKLLSYDLRIRIDNLSDGIENPCGHRFANGRLR